MTPAEEREQTRELFFLKAKIERMEREGWERDKRLLRAERRVGSLATGLLNLAIALVAVGAGYLIIGRQNNLWDWLGIAIGGVTVAMMVREAIKRFEKE